MKLVIMTLVLDGMPYITHHLPVLNKLDCDWEWRIVEGVAAPVRDTSWCKQVEPRLSTDGTSEYLSEIERHPRVRVLRNTLWPGKTAMCNAAIAGIDEPYLLMQVDSDELWTTGQLETVRQIFAQHPEKNCARFDCRYFVGHHIFTERRGVYGNRGGEWMRVFRMEPGMVFDTHEPPRILGVKPEVLDNDFTSSMGLKFHHYAYATEKQLRFKEEYYGYAGAVDGWRRLQANTAWPAKLRDFFPWVDDGCEVAPC